MDRGVKFSYSGIAKNKILRAVNSVLPRNKTITEIGLVFVSEKIILELNKKYRGKNKITNVLSFALSDPALERDRLSRMQFISFKGGDIVICPAVVKREAREYGFTQKYWMTRLVVHGILHLVGYKHSTAKSRLSMERLESRILNLLSV